MWQLGNLNAAIGPQRHSSLVWVGGEQAMLVVRWSERPRQNPKKINMEKRKESKVLTTRVTPEEHERISTEAKGMGLTVTRLLHDLVVESPTRFFIPEINRKTYQELGHVQQFLEDLEPSSARDTILNKVISLRNEAIGRGDKLPLRKVRRI